MAGRFDPALTAARRTAELNALVSRAETVDVLVIGLGVTGAGVALDAVTRGLTVVAIDAHDLAWGTSRWSSKLVHGGVRYLARLDLGLAYESAVERAILMQRTAPHLIRPLPLVLPTRGGAAGAAASAVAADLLRRAAGQPSRTLPRPRRLRAVEARSAVPGLSAQGLRGGMMMWEGQLIDDARLVIGLARTAAGYGARVLTRCRAERVFGLGAEVVDTVTGVRHLIRARSVVNATGVWAAGLVPGISLRPSRGTHLVLPGSVLGGSAGLLVPLPGERGRVAFALPQPDGTAYVGLTDDPLDGPLPEVPQPQEADLEFLLGALNTELAEPVRRQDVLGAFAGLRPLLAGRSARTADLSRRHAVLTSPDGVITVVGGKLTTYRRMAQDAVDAVAFRLGGSPGPCRTRALPLVGAAPPERLAALEAPRRLVARYGTEATEVVRLAADAPELLDPVAPGTPVTGAELAFGVRAEGALDVADLLDRRTRIGLVPATRAAAEPAAVEVLARMSGAAEDCGRRLGDQR